MRMQVCVVALLLYAVPAFAQQPPAAGQIKIASGSVVIVRGTNTIPAQVGQPVYEADTLRTGDDGKIGITLKDDTRLSLGPNSEVRLDRFAFAPAEGRLGFVLKVVKGVAAYVSGRDRQDRAGRRAARNAVGDRRRAWNHRHSSRSTEMNCTRPVAAVLLVLTTGLGSACSMQRVRTPKGPGDADLVMLLPDPERNATGRAAVSNAGASADLDAAGDHPGGRESAPDAREDDEGVGGEAPVWRPAGQPSACAQALHVVHSASSPTS